jgi:hypothetical protein
MSIPIAVCSQCGASAETGRIFCAKCGAALCPPNSLLSSNFANPDTPAEISGLKRATILIIKGVGIIAALGFWFSPVTTYPGILWCGASIVVGLLCIAALTQLDDDFIKKNENEGYWPKPLDWNSSPNNNTNEKPTDSRVD